ncbi:Extracytoplasmic solute receptor protein YiaO [Variovorax sp. PBS-H4]|uniref:TRAP transporter substrate-binding protein n=1 Tax=Variovorax sp. PBS-H4 TaxID=434008 RepID=UPI001318876F|nr:TRAP transporter substrate-binding protein [Variovorax sp. PBS-H4]VTU25036.1 Extracytoplasmic solute receptor protein YiaO [Variovorax sp. PBS-H4]
MTPFRFARWVGAVPCAALALFAAATHAADIKPRTIKFAFVNNAEHSQGIGAKRFAEIVGQKSGGKINVQVFPAGVLGGDLQVISSLQGGTVEMTAVSAGLLVGRDKAFGIFDFPFLFANAKEADAVVDGPFGKRMSERAQSQGLVNLSWWDIGFRSIANTKRPIVKAEDIKGLKIRVIQSPIYVDFFRALGANPVAMPFSELYTAMETRTVDALENPISNVEVNKFYEVSKYLSITNHMYNPMMILFSKKIWDQYTPDERELLTAAAEEAKLYQRKVSRDQDAQSLATVKKAGLQVNEVAPAELAKMRQMAQPVIDKFRKEVGEDVADAMDKAVQDARTAAK